MLDVDVADRCRAHVDSARRDLHCPARQRCAQPTPARRRSPGKHSDADSRRLELVAVAPSTLVLAEAGRTATRVQVISRALSPGALLIGSITAGAGRVALD